MKIYQPLASSGVAVPLTAQQLPPAPAPPPVPARCTDYLDVADFPQPLVRLLARFCHLIYDEPNRVVEALEKEGFAHVRPFRAGPLAGVGLVFEDHAVIAFRGTQSAPDWFIDLTFLYWGLPSRHCGFAYSWNKLAAQVLAWTTTLPESAKKYIVTGHSLGGALAILAAETLCDPPVSAAKPNRVRAVVTFGGPRVGAWGFAGHYDEMIACPETGKRLKDVTWRVTHHLDLVARVPPAVLGYLHVGNLIYIGRDRLLYLGANADIRSFSEFFDGLQRRLQPHSTTPGYTAGLAPGFNMPPPASALSLMLDATQTALVFTPWSYALGLTRFLFSSGSDHFKDHYLSVFNAKSYTEPASSPGRTLLVLVSVPFLLVFAVLMLAAFLPWAILLLVLAFLKRCARMRISTRG